MPVDDELDCRRLYVKILELSCRFRGSPSEGDLHDGETRSRLGESEAPGGNLIEVVEFTPRGRLVIVVIFAHSRPSSGALIC